MPNAQCSKDPFFSFGEGGVGWRMGGGGEKGSKRRFGCVRLNPHLESVKCKKSSYL